MAAVVRSKVSRARALWLTCDLRLDDNQALNAAIDGAESLLPVYVFDAAKFRKPALGGAKKSSARRVRFLLESVACMRQQLESKGSGLLVAVGKAPDVIPSLCNEGTQVFKMRGICSEETREEASVERQLKRSNCSLDKVWSGFLYMPDECGCPADNIPLLFTSFKNKAESRGRIRDPVSAPAELPKLPSPADEEAKKAFDEALKFLPTLEELGFPADEAAEAMKDDPRGVMKFEGGEVPALQRMKKWMFDDDKLKEYFEIRNGMLGDGYSSKFSPWLAHGCISPRRIWKNAQTYEKERVKNKSTYWLIFELTWRDFYMYMAHGQGDKIFKRGGLINDNTPWTGNRQALDKWKTGRTGDQLVDANMRELAATGFMSNRGRQNVASYLIFDLAVDWRYGAAHFEELLLDHDPTANWGNWVAAAGLTGQRVNKFNTKKQLNDYDPKRAYVNHWLQASPASLEGSSTADKLSMSLDDISRSQSGGKGGGGKGYGGKGKKGGGEDNGDGRETRKQRRWEARA